MTITIYLLHNWNTCCSLYSLVTPKHGIEVIKNPLTTSLCPIFCLNVRNLHLPFAGHLYLWLWTWQRLELIKLSLFGVFSQGWCSIIVMHLVGTASPLSGPERLAMRSGLKLPLQSSFWLPTRVDTSSVTQAGSRTIRWGEPTKEHYFK